MEFINFDKEKVLSTLVQILAEQEGAEVEFTIDKTA